MFVGSLATGVVVQRYTADGITDWTRFWLVPFAGSIVATVLFAMLFREERTSPAMPNAEKDLEALEPIAPPHERGVH